jgi:predicted Rossmann fold nucleotide-binding protein DprA/Smf involved in DNA uptake
MSRSISVNTQATLLLTAPLIAGRGGGSISPLTPGEYRRLTAFLREKHSDPVDLLARGANDLVKECAPIVDAGRLEQLLARGLLLSQAIERWQARALWVVSPADADYPARLKARLDDHTPSLLYGCGDAAILDTGGLAVVGSRHAGDFVIQYTEGIGRLAAEARCTLVSGGARGVDAAAIRGALEAGGRAVGVLADGLERAALNRDNRYMLMEGQLVLVSPYDPAAGFSVGNAMQRNKLIYALAESALVVSSDLDKGGTWAGAVEQLDKLHLVAVYIRSTGEVGQGLEALQRKGAMPWPNPQTADAFAETVASVVPAPASSSTGSAELHLARLRELAATMTSPKTATDVADSLQITKKQATAWLNRLVDEGVLEKFSRPVKYRTPGSQVSLFELPN